MRNVAALDALLAQLRALTPDELERVHAQVQVLRTLGAGPRGQAPIHLSSGNDVDERTLYGSLTKRLEKILATKQMAYEIFRSKSKHYEQFKTVAAQIVQHHEQWFPDATKLERMSMLDLYVDIVIDYMKTHGWKFYWPPVLKALELLPMIVDRQFPNYIASGMLSKVMQLRTHGGIDVVGTAGH